MNVYTDRFETVLPKQERKALIRKRKKPLDLRFFGYVILAIGISCAAGVITSEIIKGPHGTSPEIQQAIAKFKDAPGLYHVTQPTPAPVPTPSPYTFEANMPYGEHLTCTYLGELARQEALPLVGNHVGDAYLINGYVFVWVTPGGVGQWIDPVN